MNLEHVPSELLAYQDWKNLDLSFNAFSNFPDLSPLVALQELFLIGNQIEVIPPIVSKLQSLKVLFMTGNQLKVISSEIGALTNLEKLSLANNQLKQLPPEIGNLRKLEELNLSGNPLTEIPPTVSRLEYLETLDLNGCGLRELPDTFGNMPRLLDLNLGTNKLQALPDNFGNLTRLVTLNLADNEIKELPISMGRMLNLANIYLERNPIQDEELLAKYRIGTDHFVDCMEKRLFFREQELKKIQKEREDRIQQVRNPVITDSENEDLLTKLRKAKPKLIRLGYSENEDIEKLSPEEKLTRIRHAALEMVQDVKMELVDLKRSLAFTKTMEEILPVAKAVRDLINDIEQAKAHIPPVKKPYLPPPGPNESKVETLKKTTAVALREVEDVVSGMISTLATRIPESQVTTLAQIAKSINEKTKKIIESLPKQSN
jgi:Leucine-rich repeat (LRR) protein